MRDMLFVLNNGHKIYAKGVELTLDEIEESFDDIGKVVLEHEGRDIVVYGDQVSAIIADPEKYPQPKGRMDA